MHLFYLTLILTSSRSLASSIPTRTLELRDNSSLFASPIPTGTLNLRDDLSLSLNLPTITPVSISPVSIPAVSLNLPPQCTPTIPPGKNGYIPPGNCGANWNYSPSLPAALTFSILFFISFLTHTIQAIHHKTSYCWVISMASLWELTAYISRTFGSLNQQNLTLATISQITVLVAPVWVNAFAYTVFARVVHNYSSKGTVWISATNLAMVFVTLDVVAFVVQLVGGGMAGPGSDPESARKGLRIYMLGIGIQEVFVVMFSVLIGKFLCEQRRAQRGSGKEWNKVMWALCACLVFISVRIVFRLVEFSGGLDIDNKLPYDEKLFYALEAVPMLLAVGVWNVVHPGGIMGGERSKLPKSWISRMVCRGRRREKVGKKGGDHVRLIERD